MGDKDLLQGAVMLRNETAVEWHPGHSICMGNNVCWPREKDEGVHRETTYMVEVIFLTRV